MDEKIKFMEILIHKLNTLINKESPTIGICHVMLGLVRTLSIDTTKINYDVGYGNIMHLIDYDLFFMHMPMSSPSCIDEIGFWFPTDVEGDKLRVELCENVLDSLKAQKEHESKQ